MEGLGVGARSLVRNTLGVEGHAKALGWGLGRTTSKSITHMDLHKPKQQIGLCIVRTLLMHGRTTNTNS